MTSDLGSRVPGTAPSGDRDVWRGLVQGVRPKQWTKNVLVFAAPGAGGVLTHWSALGPAIASFFVFCALASGTYLFNDVIDATADRLHPVKRYRPVASGVLPASWAIGASVALMVAALAGAAAVHWRLLVVAATYLAVQFAYSLWLKHEPILDLASVAAGFILRAIAGGVAATIPISQWFLIVATFGALLMVTGKRFAEHRQLGDDRGSHRPALDYYSESFLQGVLYVSAAVATTAYCFWAFERETALRAHGDGIWFQLSIVPFVLGILRYAYMVDQGHGGRPEDLLFSDRVMQLIGLVWVIVFALGVYAS